MKLWDMITPLRAMIATPKAARHVAQRWQAAGAADPNLARDIIRLGGVMSQSPRRFQAGGEALEPICPHRLARDAGRRDFALELLALMHIDTTDLQTEMERDDEN